MTKEKWYEGLSRQEKSNIKDGAETRTGYFKDGETLKEWKARKEEIFEQLLDERYNHYLNETEKAKQEEENNKAIELEEEKAYQADLAKGVATIELYESNKYRCWAAEVTGKDETYGLARSFINPVDRKGNYKTYKLKEGKYYNYLNEGYQYFVKVVKSKLVEITQEEMMDLFN